MILVGVHTSVAALDDSTNLRLSTRMSATMSAPTSAPQPMLDYAAMPELSAQSVLVFDQASGQALISKNAALQTPIASITKLMTAILVLDAGESLDERITISSDDRDTLKGTGSRLAFGSS